MTGKGKRRRSCDEEEEGEHEAKRQKQEGGTSEVPGMPERWCPRYSGLGIGTWEGWDPYSQTCSGETRRSPFPHFLWLFFLIFLAPIPEFCISFSSVFCPISLCFPAPFPLTFCPRSPQTPPDDGIYWQVNLERFHQHFRDQALVAAVASRMDQVCGSHLRSRSGTELFPL